MPPALPPEICDIALDYLHDDIQALVKCSTLCKGWLPTCRLHLYSTVCIPFHASNLEFRLGLINLLCDPRSDHLRPLVRRIIIVGVLQYAGRLLECLEDFTKLERLDLRGIRWIQHSEQRTNLYSLPRVAHFKYLSLQDMSFGSLNEIKQLIALAPNLKNLTLIRIRLEDHPIESTEDSETSAPALPPMFETLKTCCCFPILDWIGLQSPHRIQVLHMHEISEVRAEAVCDFVHEFGSTLKELTLMCSPSTFVTHEGAYAWSLAGQEILAQRLDLSRAPTLRKIRLGSENLPTFAIVTYNLRWVVPVLSRVSSPGVEKVTLIVELDSPEQIIAPSRADFEAIGNLFMGGNSFLAHTKLQFTINGAMSLADARKMLRHNLYGLKRLGRLQCRVQNTIAAECEPH